MSIIDKIGSSVIDVGGSISQKAKEISEQARINGELVKYKENREECMRRLGELVYQEKCNGVVANTEELLQEIQVIDRFIANLTNSMNDLKGVAICSSCGDEVLRDSVFCPSCGYRMELRTAWDCPNCGKELENGVKFCTSCGTRVG